MIHSNLQREIHTVHIIQPTFEVTAGPKDLGPIFSFFFFLRRSTLLNTISALSIREITIFVYFFNLMYNVPEILIHSIDTSI